MGSVEVLIDQIHELTNSTSAGGSSSSVSRIHLLLKQSDELLHSLSSQLYPLLDQFDPSTHTLPYIYFLDAITTAAPADQEQANQFITHVTKLIKSSDADHIRLVPEKFVSVCQKMKEQILVLNDPLRGVAPLQIAIQKLQASTEHLTPLHSDFLLLCLLAKCYRVGLRVLNHNIYHVEQPRDFFLYCYYGGMIYIGLKQFQKALELLHNVVTAPMPIINAIAVEAYKKYILVSLIHNGQFSATLPKYASSVAQRNLKTLCQVYVDMAIFYSNGRVSEMEVFVNTHREKFEADSNLGLVKQAVASMYKRNIQRLTQTYLTLSLQDIATTVHLSSAKEAEMHVLQMIQNGEIFASINQKDGMVRFLEDPEQYKSCEMIERIDSSIKRMSSLSKKLSAMDKLIACDTLYLTKVGKERQRFDFDDFDSVPQRFNM
uniref:COP9 signalosome complex subunit 3 n=1 Tax=Kalanchoe fedtschenkoi TaxID=63787 RepID=A0A7N0T9K5_KALFE